MVSTPDCKHHGTLATLGKEIRRLLQEHQSLMGEQEQEQVLNATTYFCSLTIILKIRYNVLPASLGLE